MVATVRGCDGREVTRDRGGVVDGHGTGAQLVTADLRGDRAFLRLRWMVQVLAVNAPRSA